MKRRKILICFLLGLCLLMKPVVHVQATTADESKEITEESSEGSTDSGTVVVGSDSGTESGSATIGTENSTTDTGSNAGSTTGSQNTTGSTTGGQSSTGSTGTNSYTSKSLEDKKGKLSNAEKEKDALQSSLSDIKAIKEKLEKSRSDLKSYVTELDSNLSQIEAKVEQINSLITEKEQEIEETKENLRLIKIQEKKQYEAMKNRVKFIYTRGNTAYLEILFSSKSFGDMISKATYVEKLAAYDKELLVNYQETREEIATLEKELQEEQEVLEVAKQTAEQEQANVEELIVAKQEQIEAYEADISKQEEKIKEYEEYIAEQNATIASLEAAVEQEQKRLEALGKNSNVKYDGGMFTWPAPGYTRISSDYGNRMHPVLGVYKFHNGVDMAAPTGSPILAAYNGTVVAAAYNASMGNYIMINHGDGLYTVYMHCSALYVSAGATVSAGDNIGAVGSTGRSTGPHLHFSVRLNGSYVSPWNYL